VEASEVSLLQVLREIGEKVRFTVVDMSASRPALTISIKGSTLEEVLRQLLQGENHAIVYRGQERGQGQAGGAINTIFLLGPSTPRDQWQAQRRYDDIIQSQKEPTRPLDSSLAGRSITSLSGQQEPMRGMIEEDDIERTVEDLLRTHALPGLQELTGDIPWEILSAGVNQAVETIARTPRGSSTGGRSATPSPTEIDEALAITTRLAQQQIKALINGLATATGSLLDSLANQGR